MPDTKENQNTWPQPPNQKKGCGFPVAAVLGVFCLATGAAIAAVLGEWSVHDLSLLYYVRHVFERGDIMLADRAFCSFAELALMKMRGVDVVVRMHQARLHDMRRGRVVGMLDRIVTWTKPKYRPKGLRKKDYRLLPDMQAVRKVKYRVECKGFRTRSVHLATTLLDPEEWPAEELAGLYFRRWDIELDFRHIKETLGMGILRGKTPNIVRKEIFVHLLAYNLVRRMMLDAANIGGVSNKRISFKGAIQYLLSGELICSKMTPAHVYMEIIRWVSLEVLPKRPGRFEPRVRKRRPKSYPLMTRPRRELKAEMAA